MNKKNKITGEVAGQVVFDGQTWLTRKDYEELVGVGYRIPSIEEFVPGFCYEEKSTTSIGLIYLDERGKGTVTNMRPNVTWNKHTIPYPSLQFQTTFYYDDGMIVTIMPNPIWEGMTQKYYENLIESKSVRVKI